MAELITRREFLRKGGISLVAVGLTGSCSRKSQPSPTKSKSSSQNKNDARLAPLMKTLSEMRAELRSLKKALVAQRKSGGNFGPLMSQFAKKQRTYRSYHIAYSELKGKKRDDIEPLLARNKPDEATISKIKQPYL